MVKIPDRNIVFRGRRSIREVDPWGSGMALPFIGVVGEGASVRVVTGVDTQVAESVYWGPPLVSREVLRPWRVFKILEGANIIYDGMIRALWCLTGYDAGTQNRQYLDELAARLGGLPQLEDLRRRVPTLFPERQDLSILIGRLTSRGVPIVDVSLIRAVDEGHIRPTKRVSTAVHQMRARMSAA